MAYFWTDQDEGSSKATERTTADTKKGMVRTTTKFRQIQLEKTNESIENLFVAGKQQCSEKESFWLRKHTEIEKSMKNQLKKAKFRNFLLSFKARTYNSHIIILSGASKM